jgi:hypothetical protein
MRGGYTTEKFENDLKQLSGMIEGFYSNNQEGGKKPNQKSKKKLKQKKKTHLKKGGAAKRWYKVVNVNGNPYQYYRRYKGAEPKDAALKAFHFICKKLGMGKSCSITFTLKETSRGSDKRNYGPYKGHYEKLPKPRVVTIKGKGKITTVTHKRVVELVRK